MIAGATCTYTTLLNQAQQAVEAGATSPTAVLAHVLRTYNAYAPFASSSGDMGHVRPLDLGHAREALQVLHGQGRVRLTWGKRAGLWTGARVAPVGSKAVA